MYLILGFATNKVCRILGATAKVIVLSGIHENVKEINRDYYLLSSVSLT